MNFYLQPSAAAYSMLLLQECRHYHIMPSRLATAGQAQIPVAERDFINVILPQKCAFYQKEVWQSVLAIKSHQHPGRAQAHR